MRYISICILLVSLCFSSCDMETVIDLEVPPHQPVLVLNSLLDTDTNIQVTISHSVGSFSNGNPSFVRDANVLLYEDDILIDSLFPDFTDLIYVSYLDNYNLTYLPMYYYKSDYIPLEEMTYRLEVNHTDYNSISAETYVPNDVTLYNIEIDTVSDEYNIRLTVTFNDNADKQNYYRLKLSSSCKWEYEEEEKDDDFKREVLCIMSNDPSFPSNSIFSGEYSFTGNNVNFSDELFNGQQKTISLDVGHCKHFDDDLSEKIICDTIIIQFSTFADDTYAYYNSLGDHSEKGELGIFGGEVIPVYSNVENGLGILISTNSQIIYLKQ